nr:endonuclease domain-containing protein [Bacteroidota bacterium]
MVKLKNTSSHIYHYGATPEIFDRAQQLRKKMTEAEANLWKRLRNRKFEGLKFRRQHPVNRFIVDFYCHEKRLVVEVDGSIHDLKEVKERDEGREEDLKNLGLTIVRFTNEEILNDISTVLEKLKTKL